MNRLFLTICGVVFGSLYATSTLLAAGNINVELSDEGVLAIVGERGRDAAHNVYVDVDPDGILEIDGKGSTVNGQSDPVTYDLNEVTVTEISISLLTEVHVWVDTPIAADLSISGGGIGGQTVSICGGWYGSGIINGNTTITNGLGPSAIGISQITLAGNVDITSGQGDDGIYIGPYSPYWLSGPVTILGNLSINTGHGRDYIRTLTMADVAGDFQLEFGQDDDSLSAASMTVYGNAYLSGGQGDDSSTDPFVEGDLIKIGFEY